MRDADALVSADVFTAPSPYVPLPARIAVLLSGRGSNFEALAAACASGTLPATIVLVASDKPGAFGLERARARGLTAVGLSAKELGGRAALEARIVQLIAEVRADLICLAGYMKVLSADFVSRFPYRILNIHPALLPSFPGVHAQEQAVHYGVRVSGVTVHFVDSGVDTGPIIDQKAVPVLPGDDGDTLAVRILPYEHELYVSSLRRVLEGGWRIEDRRIVFA